MNTAAIAAGVADSFAWTCRTSAEALLLIALVLVVGWIAGRRLPPRWRYVLGLLVLARLILPIALPGYWSLNALVPSSAFRPVSHAIEPSAASQAVQPSNPESWRPLPVGTDASGPFVAAQPARFHLPLISAVWAAGACLILATAFARLVLFSRRVRKAIPVVQPVALDTLRQCQADFGVTRPVELLELEDLATPALFGIVRPKLLLPAGLIGQLSAEELGMIFLHELAHLKAHDVPMNWLITVTASVHWFNPAVWFAFSRLRSDRELLRDAQALQLLTPPERTAYGRVLLKLSQLLSGSVPCPSFLPVANNHRRTAERIIMIMRYKSEGRASPPLLAVVVAAIVMLTFTRTTEITAATAEAYPSAAGPRVFTLAHNQRPEFIRQDIDRDIPLRAAVQRANLHYRAFWASTDAADHLPLTEEEVVAAVMQIRAKHPDLENSLQSIYQRVVDEHVLPKGMYFEQFTGEVWKEDATAVVVDRVDLAIAAQPWWGSKDPDVGQHWSYRVRERFVRPLSKDAIVRGLQRLVHTSEGFLRAAEQSPEFYDQLRALTRQEKLWAEEKLRQLGAPSRNDDTGIHTSQPMQELDDKALLSGGPVLQRVERSQDPGNLQAYEGVFHFVREGDTRESIVSHFNREFKVLGRITSVRSITEASQANLQAITDGLTTGQTLFVPLEKRE